VHFQLLLSFVETTDVLTIILCNIIKNGEVKLPISEKWLTCIKINQNFKNMKNAIVFIFLLMAIISVNKVNASSYTINEQAIDQLFENATETAMISVNANELSSLPSNVSSMAVSNDKDAVIAIVLDFFLGGLGIHRFYLGTETLTGLGYIFTCGGIFGIVPLIDFIVLIIDNKDISPYIDNPKFFMW